MECTGPCPSWCGDFAGTRPQRRHRPGGRSEAEDPRGARVDGARTCDRMSRHCGGRVVGGMSAARRGREAARRIGRFGRVVGMVGDVAADRAGGAHGRVPITLLGIGAMEVVAGPAVIALQVPRASRRDVLLDHRGALAVRVGIRTKDARPARAGRTPAERAAQPRCLRSQNKAVATEPICFMKHMGVYAAWGHMLRR